ncbi:dipeptidase [Pontibacillus litoralis]|uniref:Diguanylate cyclase n=1 Tax=Pontibacillus litoralis JSM 072002 TaxID=1385512 RepID=A0A0A5G8I4_9BACI|nr:dipeptidase [Pontibacillus litoralis]KGX88369.1 hypothetical protein N784_06820 [Pontibacillus litoralis JSM 072002]
MIIDAHCDVLWKLWSNEHLSFHNSEELRVNYEKWKNSHVKVQCFAIFVPEEVPSEQQFQVALKMVDLFYERIIEPYDEIQVITCQEDVLNLQPHEKGAMLTLEGCHPIGEDIVKLKTLLRLGVQAVGLTWNQANAVCDGIGEERGAGLSSFGKRVVSVLNEYRIWTDVSHLSYQGFWDVMKLAEYPMASHSNAYALAPHPRNLDDEQVKELISRDAFIGVTYVCPFLTQKDVATTDDIIRHLEYIISLGGSDVVGLGSDFDGTSCVIEGIIDYTDYDDFERLLQQQFPPSLFANITYQNFIAHFPK